MAHRNEHIIIFEHTEFRGRHRHIFGFEKDLKHSDDTTLNDRMSSFVVLSGTWQLFKDKNFLGGQLGSNFGPGEFPTVPGVVNDAVSSLKAV